MMRKNDKNEESTINLRAIIHSAGKHALWHTGGSAEEGVRTSCRMEEMTDRESFFSLDTFKHLTL